MKKILLFLLLFLVLVPAIVGGVVGFAYYTTDATSVPSVTMAVNQTALPPSGYEWHQPVFGGMLEKKFVQSQTMETAFLGEISVPQIQVDFPQGYSSTIKVEKDGTVVLEGNAEKWKEFTLPGNGQYLLQITSHSQTAQGLVGFGTFYFQASFSLQVPPAITASAQSLAQGDVLAIQISHLPEGTNPTAETELGMVTFTTQATTATALVPIAYNREPGEYTILVQAGELEWSLPVQVKATEFTRQELTIDTSDPVIGEANSPAAYQQYRDKIYPLFETADTQTYWSGLFLQPVQGRITTEYGLRRYTNGATTPSRHVGVDIAASEGTAVVAPNGGRVVMAEFLLNTGNTLVIEHGGGLKSYFFHMEQLNVAPGAMVNKGDLVGTVGTTGYSTGPHLHYEVRIGNQSISPALLFSGESGLYFFSKK